MAASQKATCEAPSFAELPKLVSPTTNRIWVRTRSRSPSSRLSRVGPLEGIAHYSGAGAFALRGVQAYFTLRGKPGVQKREQMDTSARLRDRPGQPGTAPPE